MTKREYVIRQIAKTNKKNYENYVVTRIYHLLNRTDVKFVTQQYVNRPEGHALCNCLGQNYKAVQQAWFKSKIYPNHYLWFPKFYENEDWDNQISKDGTVITEKCKDLEKYNSWFNTVTSNLVKRITFPRSIDNLGFRLYRFAGVFETDLESSSLENGVVHRLKETRIEINI